MTDTTSLVNVLQTQNTILTQLLKAFLGGILVDPTPAVYTVAGLPATAASGQWAFASNGRKPGEGAAAGTGVPVFFNTATNTWFAYTSGAVVTS
jgi:hypothetical protein